MVKKSSGSRTLRRPANRPVTGSATQVPNSSHKSSMFTMKKFILIFVIGFFLAIIPDIIQIQRHIYEDMTRPLDQSDMQNLTDENWYKVDIEAMPDFMKEKFIQMGEDDMTNDFLINSKRKSKVLFREVFHSLFSAVLQYFMTWTSINGLLGRSKMFVFSEKQFTTLMDKEEHWKEKFLLDIGAGDGTITEIMSPYFDQTSVTEISQTMSWALRRKGFHIADAHTWHAEHKLYDVVTCLNVLDRTDEPIKMLENIRKVLYPGGIVIVSMVLPLQQYYEYGNRKPKETLLIQGSTFEEQAKSLVMDIFKPLSYQLIKFTKLPYLSEGNRKKSFYKLDDVVFVFSIM